MGKSVAIIQSNYIPWKGYFDIINYVDEFILYDDMQYTKRDWRNRNKIKAANGTQWLSIPIKIKGRNCQKIKDAMISNPNWKCKHWNSICHNYAKAKYFKTYRILFEELYLGMDETHLSQINLKFLTAICDILGIDTKLSWSMDYKLVEGKSEKLVDLCKQLGASEYLTGPLSKQYIDEGIFKKEGIRLHYMDYSGYPEYRQLFPPFDHYVSIVDLIFNLGPNAKKFMKSFNSSINSKSSRTSRAFSAENKGQVKAYGAHK